MNSTLLATGLALSATALTAFAPATKADTILGLYLGAEGWQSSTSGSFAQDTNLQNFDFEDKTFSSFYAALEHPVPLVPNLKIRHTELELDGSTTLQQGFKFGDQVYQIGTSVNSLADLTHNDYVLYYEIFDNTLVSIDIGINAKQFDGSFVVTGTPQGGSSVTETVEFSGFVPLAYGAASVGLPFTGLSVFFEGSLLAIDDSKVQDIQAGIAWEFIDNLAVDVALKAGYRAVTIELEDLDDTYTDIEVDGPFAGIQVHF